ncbi:hypothetical protein DPMN_016011 [Dreissena polymorpha]|uniref:Uncharacterized protein n=1 Tax=Dreissena polymorpha TaxID=45954 RepID=A0A9D4S508_DREPO|nr:hypothetical protein DPMN_016011 [Dreissena polymorpha]
MKLHRYIDHDWQMTPIDFQVTRSKVKVTVTRNKHHHIPSNRKAKRVGIVEFIKGMTTLALGSEKLKPLGHVLKGSPCIPWD